MDTAETQFSETGPLTIASRWVTSVLRDKELRPAWALMTHEMRERIAKGWVDANRAHPLVAPFNAEELIGALVEDSPNHPLWDGFERTQLKTFAEVASHIDYETSGFGGDPRVLGPDTELVIFVDTGSREPVTIEGDDVALPGIGLVMRYEREGRWLLHDLKLGGDLTEETAR